MNFEDFDSLSDSTFDDLYEIFSEADADTVCVGTQPECFVERTYISEEPQELISAVEKIFITEELHMHLATVHLLGNLSYSDLLVYYCAVTDMLDMNKTAGDSGTTADVTSPEQYIQSCEAEEKTAPEVRLEYKSECYETVKRIIAFLKNKEFEILSNTFYADGADFFIFLSLKSATGYNLRLKIAISCKSDFEAQRLTTMINQAIPKQAPEEE